SDSTASTTAQVIAGTAQTTNLDNDETLTFTGALFGTLTVTLDNAYVTTQQTVVDTINASTAGKYVQASIGTGNKLTITARVAGALGTFTVKSSLSPDSDQSGFSTTPSAGVGQDLAVDAQSTAQVTASTAQTTYLKDAETLAFDGVLFSGLTDTKKEIALTDNSTIASVIDQINNSTVIGKFITASDVNGYLTLTSKVAGVEGTFFVVSNKDTGADRAGIGTTTCGGRGEDAGGQGPLTMQIDVSASGNSRLDVAISGVGSNQLGLRGTDILTQSSASTTITLLDSAISKVSSSQTQVGSLLNRTSIITSYLSERVETLTQARDRIMNADIAQGTANLVASEIRLNASTALMAQGASMDRLVLLLYGLSS
ncbi:MAG: flagellin, partial [Pseudomonadota bacterium]